MAEIAGTSVSSTDLPGLVHRGKVRDMYRVTDDLLLMVATDRISAYDVIMRRPIPGKGALLTQMSAYWFTEVIGDLAPHHMVCLGLDDADMARIPRVGALAYGLPEELRARSMVVRAAERLDIECVVRGYLAGSGWEEYSAHGTLNGAPLPKGLPPAVQLSPPMFTPSAKSDVGHDEPLTEAEARRLVGDALHDELASISVRIYERAATHAASAGMILVDTKFEFGYVDGRLTLIDEVLTPDSSRFWDASDWEPGAFPPAYDKQHLREWLTTADWNREPPPPELPQEVIDMTRDRYVSAYERLTGREASW